MSRGRSKGKEEKRDGKENKKIQTINVVTTKTLYFITVTVD